MSVQAKKISKTTVLKDIIHMIRVGRIPLHYFILNFIVSLITTKLFIELPLLASKIASGQLQTTIINNYVALTIAQTVIVSIIVPYFSSWFHLEAQRRIRLAVWNKVLRLKQSDLDKENPLTLVSRITQDSDYINTLIGVALGIVTKIYTVILIYSKMYALNKNMTLLLLLALVIIVIATVALNKPIAKAQKNIQDIYARVTASLAEKITNLRSIKAFGKEKYEIDEINKQIDDQVKANIKITAISSLATTIGAIGHAFSIIVIFGIGGVLLKKGQLELAQLVAFFMYTATSGAESNLMSIFWTLNDCAKYVGGLNKVRQILNYEDEIVTRKNEVKPTKEDIIFKNVSFGYKDQLVLNNLNFSIPSGKVTAIVGPSGSGKTTILKLLERFYSPTSGEIVYDNINLEDYHLDQWRDNMGYIVQNSPLISGTIKDNITYGLHEQLDDNAVIEATKIANAYDFINSTKEGLNSEVGELGGKLSGGQKQRIAIARAIIKNPEIMLLDEATCSLDATNEYEVTKALRNAMQGRTTVVVAHNMGTIKDADNIIVIDKGQVVGNGNHQTLYKENKIYKKYFDLQFEQ